jgi:hypothetical protein
MVDEIDGAAAAAGISRDTYNKIPSDGPNMSHVSQHSVQHILTKDQRDNHMSICGDLTDSADKDRMFLNRIIRDETCCFLHDPQLKRQSATWESPSSPRKEKPRQDRSKCKVMLELFFDSFGIVHLEFIPEGATGNKHCYKKILCRLCNSIYHKRPELWHRKNWLLLHDNTPAHRSVLVQ